jgi:hypothetical protein
MGSQQISRRRVVAGAAWGAPAIVVASAVPAMALSGPANVLITIPPTADSGGTLTVEAEFVNRNTGATGLITTAFFFTPTTGLGSVPAQTPTINSTGTTPGWTFTGQNNDSSDKSFSFSRAAPGIPGAPDATSTSDPVMLSFTITVTPGALDTSAGQIRTLSVVQSGSAPQANSLWA